LYDGKTVTEESITTPKNDNPLTLKLREFDLNEMVKYPHICLIGKREAGKTTIITNMLDKQDDYFLENTLIISPKDKIKPFYKNRYPKAEVIFKYDSAKIQEYLDKRDLESQTRIPGAIVFDDSLGSNGAWMKDPTFMELVYNGRHYRKMVITAMQFPLGVKPEIRCNFDYVFMLNEDFYSNQKRLYDHYAGIFPNFKTFRDVFIETTKDYGSMLIVNRGSSTDVLDKVFHYKATIKPLIKKENIYTPHNYYHLVDLNDSDESGVNQQILNELTKDGEENPDIFFKYLIDHHE